MFMLMLMVMVILLLVLFSLLTDNHLPANELDWIGQNRSANASWSTTELRAKRNEVSSLFFDMMIEPDGDTCVVGAASSPLTNSSSSSGFEKLMNSSIK